MEVLRGFADGACSADMMFTVQHAQARFEELLALVDTGEDVLIMRVGKPAMRLLRPDGQLAYQLRPERKSDYSNIR